MSSRPGSNGILDGKANADKFEAWQREVLDFKPFIHKGSLSISRIATECGLNRDVFYTNPEIRDRLLPELSARLESLGLLKARMVMPATVMVHDRSGVVGDGAMVKRLIAQNEAYKVEITELRLELQKYEAVKNMLSETGRLPW